MTVLETISDLCKSIETAISMRPKETGKLIDFLEAEATGGTALEIDPVVADIVESLVFVLETSLEEEQKKHKTMSTDEILRLLRDQEVKLQKQLRELRRWENATN